MTNMDATTYENIKFDGYVAETNGTHMVFGYPETSNKNARVFFSIVPMKESRPFFKAVMHHGDFQKKLRFGATKTDQHTLECKYGRHYLCTMNELDEYLAKARAMVTCNPNKLNHGHAFELALCELVFNCAWENKDLDKPHTKAGDITVGAYEYQCKFKAGRI